jgi:hypothetical protein
MKRSPIGISDYKEIIEGDYYYVDKTLLIKELVEIGGKVTLLPRPRRFGKTLNLSMLKYFFEHVDDPTQTGTDTFSLMLLYGITLSYRDCKALFPLFS